MFLLVLSLVSLLGMLGFLINLLILSLSREQLDPAKVTTTQWPTLSVIIPARNEEANIGKSLGAILGQDYPMDKLEVIVVDDYSEDRTHAIVDELAAGSPVNLRCVMGRPLPTGWIGKSNACQAGALAASGEYLLFMDADTDSGPEMLRCAVDFALQKKADLLSFNPRQEMVSRAEKLLLPGLFLAVASSMKFRQSNNPACEEAIANGQAMMFRHPAYKEVGGHGLVAGEISEDLAFARGMKARGYTIYWAFADKIMRTRMYTGAEEIWDGFSKNMNRIMKCETKHHVVAGTGKALLLAWANPLLVAASGIACVVSPGDTYLTALAVSGLTQIIMLVASMYLVRELHQPLGYAFAIPLGITVQGLLVFKAYQLARDKQITWKGRVIE